MRLIIDGDVGTCMFVRIGFSQGGGLFGEGDKKSEPKKQSEWSVTAYELYLLTQ